MRVEGTLEKDGKWWVASIPSIGVDTQGTSVGDAHAMVKDAIESLDDDGKVRVRVEEAERGFYVENEGDVGVWLAFVLRRMRELRGMSLEDVRQAIGATSRNAYARYETGAVVPSVEKFDEIIGALGTARIVLRELGAAGHVESRKRDPVRIVGRKLGGGRKAAKVWRKSTAKRK
jgi:hypothetical protein